MKRLVATLACILLLTACGTQINMPYEPEVTVLATTVPITTTPVTTAPATTVPEPTVPEPAEPIAPTAPDAVQIPLWGSHQAISLTPSQAKAYAQTVEDAYIRLGDMGDYPFDDVYPIFIDVAGDGVPLLLLLCGGEYPGEQTAWRGLPLNPNLLFGYADGTAQLLARFEGVGLMYVDGEWLLSIGSVSDFGGVFNFYRVTQGSTVFSHAMEFVADWHGDISPYREISVDGEIMTAQEYWAVLATVPTKPFVDRWHPGNVVVTSYLTPYLHTSFTRQQLVDMLLTLTLPLEVDPT